MWMKRNNELNGSVELNLICLIAVLSNLRMSTAGCSVPAKLFRALPRTNFIKCVGLRVFRARFLFVCQGFFSTRTVNWSSVSQTWIRSHRFRAQKRFSFFFAWSFDLALSDPVIMFIGSSRATSSVISILMGLIRWTIISVTCFIKPSHTNNN